MAEVVEFWTPESLETFSQETKNVNVSGKYFQIKKLKAEFMEKKEGEIKPLQMIVAGLAKPELDQNALKRLPVDLVNSLAKEIMEFSGLTTEEAEKN